MQQSRIVAPASEPVGSEWIKHWSGRVHAGRSESNGNVPNSSNKWFHIHGDISSFRRDYGRTRTRRQWLDQKSALCDEIRQLETFVAGKEDHGLFQSGRFWMPDVGAISLLQNWVAGQTSLTVWISGPANSWDVQRSSCSHECSVRCVESVSDDHIPLLSPIPSR
jgi:hypothetical protein